MAKIVGIGANVYDTLYRMGSYPQEDHKYKANSVTESGGGPCATGLVAAAKLGGDCAFIGNCSDDGPGRFLCEDFNRYGVDTGLMTPVADTKAFCSCIWLADDHASRTCVFHRGTVPPTQLTEEAKAAIREASLLMVDGNDLAAAVEGAKVAKESDTLVLYDAGGLYEGVEALLEQTDILIPSEEFALKHTGAETVSDAAKKLWNMYHPKLVVITCGKEGGVLFDGAQVLPYAAFPVDAVDTNGSGDVFHGAFAFALTQGYAPEKCCVFASAVAALKCTKVGARLGAPIFNDVVEFLQSRGVEWN